MTVTPLQRNHIDRLLGDYCDYLGAHDVDGADTYATAAIEQITDMLNDEHTTPRTADTIIAALLGTLDALGAAPYELTSADGATYLPASPQSLAAAHARDMRLIAMRAYDAAEWARYGNNRPPPRGTSRHSTLVVWKQRANRATFDRRAPIRYGWSWRCDHPDHTATVAGSSIAGHADALDNALRHHTRYHT